MDTIYKKIETINYNNNKYISLDYFINTLNGYNL